MSIYLDTSSKGDGKGVTARRHWIWRLDIRVDGRRIRCRSKDYNHLAGIQDKLRDGSLTPEQVKERRF